ncbi:hypothetical protein [Haloferula sp.]|uniref:hypothetical protein n=1 Tax=Haloferula sp. TaxID=2497595 RepID=UPI003C763D3A
MKPQYVIALVVVAVLATVVIEETRISKMRAEIIRLQALPDSRPAPEPEPAEPAVEIPPSPEPSIEPTPEVAPAPAATLGRVIPKDFPDPDDATIKRLAVDPYSDFAYEIGLNNRERAYLDELLAQRTRALQETAAKWMAADSSGRDDLEDDITLIIANSDDQIATFLNNEQDAKAFANYHAMQPEREQLTAMAADLDAAGATLEIEKEKQLIEALYQARVGTGSLDWNSTAGLIALDEGGTLEQFETEWTAQGNALKGLLPKFLSETEMTAVLLSREQRKAEMIASLELVIEAINGGGE